MDCKSASLLNEKDGETHPNPERRFERWQPSGIIMMDYPDHEIIAQIVIDNFWAYYSAIHHHKNADCKSTMLK